jgi:murein DD-endopeptidase MepM/ murein hydrolase activator NlpD
VPFGQTRRTGRKLDGPVEGLMQTTSKSQPVVARRKSHRIAALFGGLLVIAAGSVGILRGYYAGAHPGPLHAAPDWTPPAVVGFGPADNKPLVSRAEVKVPAVPAFQKGSGLKGYGFTWPVRGSLYITSPFGRRGNGFHHGTDIGCGIGQPLFASRAGTVYFAGPAGDAYGNAVVIDHGGSYQTVYGHLSRLDVRPGQVVGTQQLIGLCGMTGNASGPHVHFELRYNGYVWDPTMFLP